MKSEWKLKGSEVRKCGRQKRGRLEGTRAEVRKIGSQKGRKIGSAEVRKPEGTEERKAQALKLGSDNKRTEARSTKLLIMQI